MIEMKHKPWQRQKELQKMYSKQDIPTISEVNNKINDIRLGKIDQKFQTKRARALFAMYYLTAGRATEILQTNSLRKRKMKTDIIFDKGIKQIIYHLDENDKPLIENWIEEHDFLGIRKLDIKEKEYSGYKCLEIRIENRKNKDRKSKLLPVPISKELNIVNHILTYIKGLEPDEVLFKFGRRRASQIINETTGFNIHFIRHIRATHLITEYDFNDKMLIKFMGWADGRPAERYLELRSSDLAKEFHKNN